jgi:hypothetical protein
VLLLVGGAVYTHEIISPEMFYSSVNKKFILISGESMIFDDVSARAFRQVSVSIARNFLTILFFARRTEPRAIIFSEELKRTLGSSADREIRLGRNNLP